MAYQRGWPTRGVALQFIFPFLLFHVLFCCCIIINLVFLYIVRLGPHSFPLHPCSSVNRNRSQLIVARTWHFPLFDYQLFKFCLVQPVPLPVSLVLILDFLRTLLITGLVLQLCDHLVLTLDSIKYFAITSWSAPRSLNGTLHPVQWSWREVKWEISIAQTPAVMVFLGISDCTEYIINFAVVKGEHRYMNYTIELLTADHKTVEVKKVINMTTYRFGDIHWWVCRGKAYSFLPQGRSGWSCMATLKFLYEVMAIKQKAEHQQDSDRPRRELAQFFLT